MFTKNGLYLLIYKKTNNKIVLFLTVCCGCVCAHTHTSKMEMCAVSCGCEHTHTVEEETMCSSSWVWGHSYLSKRQNCFFYMPYIIAVTMATGQLAECQSAAFFCMCASLQIKCRSAEFGAVHIANRASLSLSLSVCVYLRFTVSA